MVGAFLLAGVASVSSGPCFAQTAAGEFVSSDAEGIVAPGTTSLTEQPGRSASPLPARGDSSNRFAVGAKISTLGIGGEVAYRLSHRFNVRGGFNVMSLSHSFNDSGITYAGQLHFRSAEAHLDWFFLGPLYLSPGALLYNGNNVTATAAVQAGQTFTLNSVNYESSTASPVSGNASLKLNKVAPSLLLGVGNMIPRSGRHFGAHFEIGAMYEGAPNIVLGLSGMACAPPASSGASCQDVATTPGIQTNVTAQQNKVNHDAAPYRFYPIISTGFSIAF